MANFGVFTRNYRQHISTSGTGGVFAPVLEKKGKKGQARFIPIALIGSRGAFLPRLPRHPAGGSARGASSGWERITGG